MANVLIVDDEFEIRILLKELLAAQGLSPTLASNTTEARQALAQQSFELVLLDIRMPGESGLEFLEQIHNEVPDTAFIMVSVISDAEVAKLALRLGAYGYISKPFDRNEILINVASALRRRELEIEKRTRLEDLEQAVAEKTAFLTESEKRFRTLVEGMREGLAVVDERGRLTYVNDSFCQMLQFSSEDLLGRPLSDFLADTNRAERKRRFQGRMKGGEEEYEIAWQRADGRKVFSIMSPKSLFDEEGTFKGSFGVINDITERKLAADALARSEERYRGLTEAAPNAILVHRDLTIEYVNPAAVKLLRASGPDQLIGRSYLDLVHPEDRAESEERLRKLNSDQASAPLRQHRLVALDGQAIEVESTEAAFRQEGRIIVQSIAQDITERKRSEEAILRAKEEWERTFDAVPDLIFILDKNYRIARLNLSMAERLGLRPKEAIGKSCFELVHGRKKPSDSCPFSDLLVDGDVHSVEVSETKLGGDFVITTAPLRATDGEVLGAVHVARDVTEQKRMERRLFQAQKLEAIGQLAAGIAHEINTPTQYIHANIEFLEETFGKLSEATRQLPELVQAIKSGTPLEAIIQDSERALEEAELDYVTEEVTDAIRGSLDGVGRISKIVDSMKYFSHPGTEERSVIDVNHALENAVTVSRNEWKYWADLETEFDPSLPSLSAFEAQLNQALLNIIINAAQAIGGQLGDSPKEKGKIVISTSRQDQWIEIRISDTGPGIPEEIRSRIFDPFFTTKEVGKGTGQGLALVHSVIVDKHGGTIDVETEVGRGTTFIVGLPVDPEGTAGARPPGERRRKRNS